MTEAEFKRRTRQFALDVIAFTETLPRTTASSVIARQLIRCATSVGANYRASCRARSIQEIVAKLSIVEEEADESIYWLELLLESNTAAHSVVAPLADEANQLVAMTVASKKTLKQKIGTRGFAQSPIANRES